MSIPILFDLVVEKTRLWATIGVRLVNLDVKYVRAPKIRANDQARWEDVEQYQLGRARYVIAVDEFTEFELPGRRVLTRQELRDICDRCENKTEIVEALGKQ